MTGPGRLVVLGVSSSVGIYKACEILRGFQKAGFEVQVVMTPNAAKLVSPRLFSALSGRRAAVDPFDDEEARRIGHVRLAQEAALLVVAPATANIIAKFASGLADDFLSTLHLAVTCPVLIAPAMNEAMYLHPQTQENIKRLKARGAEFIEPGSGYLACGDEGWGRLAPVEAVVQAGLRRLEAGRTLAKKTVLVTAGPTRERLDPVRFLSNPSSGRMGYALAAEALRRGARTILITGPVSLVPPAGAETVRVESAEEMRSEVLARFGEADAVLMAAAVSDFRFSQTRSEKARKEDLPETWRLVRNADILAELGRLKTRQVLVGFAAETGDVEEGARRKLREKNCDLLAANDVSRKGLGFESEDNELLLVEPSGTATPTGRAPKTELSRIVLDRVEVLLERRR
ncbi:MAG: bifunctional phosphopantothenoylcysteine decarboxylase/phosphopantothenate--cysteine ligase CoaBC [Candidatus Aminicenantes bacterium]|nr:bifunctional phosphopantothenoylcysteine decarboxylase/phosphopantothenate--cysteine ligase CoaBC [Candidatus Aminicenantes bacterium]